jgi:Uma2 family endonuclease
VSSTSTIRSVALRRFTRDEYDRLIAEGFFHPEERLELIDGRIVEKMTQGSRHATAVRLVEIALNAVFGDGFDVRVQLPIALDDFSEPEPDVAVVTGAPRDYRDAHPTRALLVVEVSDATLRFDRRRKLALYARCEIPEVWIVNLLDGVVEVHRDPAGITYRTRQRLAGGETVSPGARPGARIAVADVLP